MPGLRRRMGKEKPKKVRKLGGVVARAAKNLGSKKSQTRQLDKLCREVVFARDGHKCAKTGATENLQWSHVYSRRYRSLRWDIDNSLCLTAGAHLWWHHKPLEAIQWFTATYPNRAARLRILSQIPQKVDVAAVKMYLELELARINSK